MAVSRRKLNRTYRRGELGSQLQTLMDYVQDIGTKYATLKTLVDELKTDFGTHVTTYNSLITGAITEIKSDVNGIKDNNNTLRAGAITKMAAMYHAKRGAPHTTADTGNVLSTADPTDQATANSFLNGFKTKFNAHIREGGGVHKLANMSFDYQKGSPHARADATNTEATADATDLASVQTLLTSLKAKYNAHIALVPCHYAADATNDVTSADATDEATSVTLANEIKADLNAHLALATTTGHYQADGRNAACATANATNTATAIILANVLKALYNAHISAAFTATYEADVITSAAATDEASSVTLVNELKADLNTHLANRVPHIQADTKNAAIATADATGLATVLTLAAEVKTVYNAHLGAAESCDGTTHTALTASNYAAETLALAYTPTQETVAIAASSSALSASPPDDLVD